MSRSTLRVGLVAAAVLATAASLTACGSSSEGESSSSSGAGTSVDAALAAKVPDAIKSDGKIVIGVDATYAPNEFLDTDGQTVIGFNIDLFDAVAAKLGLQTEWVPAPFANIIPSVQSGKYEIGVSSFTVNEERMQIVNMVSYFSAGTQWATQKGNPNSVDPDAACGLKVAVQKATVQVDDVEARSKACTDAGKSAITIDQYQGQDQATASVVSGKDVAMLADSPIIAYAVKQTNDQLELLGDIYDSAPYGYAIQKEQTDFAQAVADAVKALIADGTYKSVLDEWGVSQGAITDPTVNPTLG
ncbi:MAG: ABC transporter substrate-binding protein [Actinomycetia bacterium]|nr:ABC transporter substrate-binding protein [Actinomycetes bacterium]